MAIQIDRIFGMSQLVDAPERDLAANAFTDYATMLRDSFGPILPQHGLSIVGGIAQANLEKTQLVEDLNHSFEKFAEQQGVGCGGSPNGSPTVLDTLTHGFEHALVGHMQSNLPGLIKAATFIDRWMRPDNLALILVAGEGLTEQQLLESLENANTNIQRAIVQWELSNSSSQ